MHVLIFCPVVDHFPVLVTDYDMVTAIVRKCNLNCNPLVIWEEKCLRLRLVVVFISKEVELSHIWNFKIKHEDFMEFEEITIVGSIGRVASGTSCLVYHDRHTHHVVVLLLLKHTS